MKTIALEQNKALHGLLGKLGLMPDKAELVRQYTNGRTDSSREMHWSEADSLIKFLRQQLPPPPEAKMVNTILGLAHELRWRRADGKVDIERLNEWLVKYGHTHKKLNDIPYDGLPQTVTQLRNVLKTFLESV